MQKKVTLYATISSLCFLPRDFFKIQLLLNCVQYFITVDNTVLVVTIGFEDQANAINNQFVGKLIISKVVHRVVYLIIVSKVQHDRNNMTMSEFHSKIFCLPLCTEIQAYSHSK